ncbi:MAG: hypothetical protein U0930_26210 [Pirellulales bacterium]
MRCVVKLAEAWRATIVVPQSSGNRYVSNITCNDGWFGTTLADAAEHSQLVIAIGSNWIHQLPRLKDRFFSQRQNQIWWQIRGPDLTDPPSSPDLPSFPGGGNHCSVWPRDTWYARICELVQQIARNDVANSDGLAKHILQSNYTTIIWEKSELAESQDEFLIYQLNQLAKVRSQHARCSLLALDSDVGSVTASAVLLWLTGCSDVAVPNQSNWSQSKWSQSNWISPAYYHNYEIDDWTAEFDFVVRINTTASRKSATAIPAHLHLDHFVSDSGMPLQLQSTSPNAEPVRMRVGVAGIDHDAILFRGDHGLTCFSPAERVASSLRPEDHSAVDAVVFSAAQVLQEMQLLIKDQGKVDL